MVPRVSADVRDHHRQVILERDLLRSAPRPLQEMSKQRIEKRLDRQRAVPCDEGLEPVDAKEVPPQIGRLRNASVRVPEGSGRKTVCRGRGSADRVAVEFGRSGGAAPTCQAGPAGGARPPPPEKNSGSRVRRCRRRPAEAWISSPRSSGPYIPHFLAIVCNH